MVQRSIESKHGRQNRICKLQGQCPDEFPEHLRSIVQECDTDLRYFSILRKSCTIDAENNVLYYDTSTTRDLRSGLYSFKDRIIRVVEISGRQTSENGWQMIMLPGSHRDVCFRDGWWRKTDALIVQAPGQNANTLQPIERLTRLDKYLDLNETDKRHSRSAETKSPGVPDLCTGSLVSPARSDREHDPSVMRSAGSNSVQIHKAPQLSSSKQASPEHDHVADIQLTEGDIQFQEFPPPLRRRLIELEKSDPDRLSNVLGWRWTRKKSLAWTADGRRTFFKVDKDEKSPVLEAARYSYGLSHQIVVVFLPKSKGDGTLIPIMVKGGESTPAMTISGHQYAVSKWRVIGVKDEVNYRKAPLTHILRFTELDQKGGSDTDFVDNEQVSDRSLSEEDISRGRANKLKRSRRNSSTGNQCNKQRCLKTSCIESVGVPSDCKVHTVGADRRDGPPEPADYGHNKEAVSERLSIRPTNVQEIVYKKDYPSEPGLRSCGTQTCGATASESIEDTAVTRLVAELVQADLHPDEVTDAAYEGIRVVFRDQDEGLVAVDPFRLNDSACKLSCRAAVHKLIDPIQHSGTFLEISIAGESEYIGLNVQEDWTPSVLNRLARFAPKQPVDIIVRAIVLKQT